MNERMSGIRQQYEGITYVIPCSEAKAARPAPARALYQGTMFRDSLRAAEATVDGDVRFLGENARILILSAKYGLVELDQVLEPYEQRMKDPGSISTDQLVHQALRLGIDWGSYVYCFLPRPYFRRLDEALRRLDVYAADVYEAAPGIGYQRGVLSNVARPLPAACQALLQADRAGPVQEAGDAGWGFTDGAERVLASPEAGPVGDRWTTPPQDAPTVAPEAGI